MLLALVLCASHVFGQDWRASTDLVCAGGSCNSCPSGKCGVLPFRRPPQQQVQQQAHPAVVKIVSSDKRGNHVYQMWGSGTAYAITADNRVLILTCAHIFDADYNPAVIFPFAPGIHPARLEASDAPLDLALLSVAKPATGTVKVMPFVAKAPRAGGQALICGYPKAGAYRFLRAAIRGYRKTKMFVAGVAIDGQSGGPVADSNGLIGVISKVDPQKGETFGPHIGVIRKWLASIMQARTLSEPQAQGGAPEPESTAIKEQDAPVPAPEIFRLETDVGELREKLSAFKGLAGELTNIKGKIGGLTELRARLDALGNVAPGLAGLRTRLEELHSHIGDIKSRVDASPTASAVKKTVTTLIAEKMATTEIGAGVGTITALSPGLIAAIAAATGCPPLLVAGLMWIGWRRIKKRLNSSAVSEGSTTTAAATVVPPPVQQTTQRQTPIVEQLPPQIITQPRNREFVAYELPNGRLRALEQAMDEFVRRHPGSRATIETIESYADQIQSGQKDSESKTE